MTPERVPTHSITLRVSGGMEDVSGGGLESGGFLGRADFHLREEGFVKTAEKDDQGVTRQPGANAAVGEGEVIADL